MHSTARVACHTETCVSLWTPLPGGEDLSSPCPGVLPQTPRRAPRLYKFIRRLINLNHESNLFNH